MKFSLRAADYTFTPGSSQIAFSLSSFDVRGLLYVGNATTKTDIYVAGDPALPIATVAGSTVTFTASMTGMASSDILVILYDDRVTAQPTLSIATATANAVSEARVTSAASTNATSLKTSAGNLVEIEVYNLATSVRFLKVYNKASAPTVGTDTPTWTIPIPAGGGFAWAPPIPRTFATGLAYAITGAVSDTDTTAVAASDVVGIIRYV